MTEECTTAFEKLLEGQNLFIPAMSLLFAYGAKVRGQHLTKLVAARTLDLKDLEEIFLGGLTFVDNPFVQGVRCAFESSLAASQRADGDIGNDACFC